MYTLANKLYINDVSRSEKRRLLLFLIAAKNIITMSTMVAVTVALTLPCVLLGEPPADVYDHARISVVSGLRAPPMFDRAESVQKMPHPVDRHDRDVGHTWTSHPTNGPNHTHKDRSTLQTDTLESKNKFSTDLEKSTRYVTDEDIEKMENTNYGNGWTTILNPEQSFVAELTPPEISENVGGSSGPPSGIGELNSFSEYYDNTLDPLSRQNSRFPGLNQYFAPSIGTYFGTQPLNLPNGEVSILVASAAPNPQVATTNPQVATTIPQVATTNPQVATTNPQVATTIPQVATTNPQVATTNPQVPITNPQIPIINTESTNMPTVQILTSSPQQQNMMAVRNINWLRIGILLALIKLGLVKLKAFGFIKTLLFFLFKLKMLWLLVFLKFILIFNVLVFKLIMFPLFLLPSLPIIASLISPTFMVGLLSIPEKIIRLFQGPGYFSAITPAATTATETSISSSSMANPLNSGKTTIIPGSATKTRSLF